MPSELVFLTLLGEGAARSIGSTLVPHARLVHIGSSARLLEILTCTRTAPVVFDPTLLQDADIDPVLRAVTHAPLGITVLAPLTARGVERALAFARGTAAQVVFYGQDEDRSSIATALLRTAAPGHSLPLYEALCPSLRQLPPPLQHAIRAAFFRPDGPTTTAELASVSAMSIRSVQRWLARIGIESPRLLIAAARFSRAYGLLVGTHMSIRRIARLAGYSSARRFDRHARELTGSSLMELRRDPAPTSVVSEIMHRLAHDTDDADASSHP